jgi:hypothetical protein
LAAATLGVLAFLVGRFSGRLPRPYWLLGYLLPLGIILLNAAAAFYPELASAPPLSWMTIGRSRFVCFNFVTTMLLSAPLLRLPRQRTRIVLCALIAVLTCVSIVPLLAPAFNRSYLAGLKTRLDSDGVCRQSSDYTCGPAAAVTALRKLGFPAEEGEIAILAHASSLTGTDPDVLAAELRKHYAGDGLKVQYRAFRDVEDLKRAGLTVAVMRFNALQDHCVTVLGIETNNIVVADPLSGLTYISPAEFESKWQFAGIVLSRVTR